MSGGFAIEAHTRLAPDDIRDLTALVERITDHDGLRPLSEHVWLHLKEGGDEHGLHLVAHGPDGAVAGYAHLDATDEVEGPSAEVAVDPRPAGHAEGQAREGPD